MMMMGPLSELPSCQTAHLRTALGSPVDLKTTTYNNKLKILHVVDAAAGEKLT